MAVRVQLARRVGRGLDVVAALLVRRADLLDRRGPVGLRRAHLRLGDGVRVDRGGRAAGRVRHGRVVEEDADLAVVAALVAERVLDLGLAARRRAREVVVAHRDRGLAVEVDLVVVEHDLRPALAAVDREAAVLGDAAVVDRLLADEVRHRLGRHRAELHVGRLGRLEEHVRVAVRVQRARRLAGGADEVLLLEVRRADLLDRARPERLRRARLTRRDRRAPSRWRWAPPPVCARAAQARAASARGGESRASAWSCLRAPHAAQSQVGRARTRVRPKSICGAATLRVAVRRPKLRSERARVGHERLGADEEREREHLHRHLV